MKTLTALKLAYSLTALLTIILSIYFFMMDNLTASFTVFMVGSFLTVGLIFWRHIFLTIMMAVNVGIIFIIAYVYYINQPVDSLYESGIFFLATIVASFIIILGTVWVGGKYVNVNIFTVIMYQTFFNLFITPVVLFSSNMYSILVVPLLQPVPLIVAVAFLWIKTVKNVTHSNVSVPDFLTPVRKNIPAGTVKKLSPYLAKTNINGHLFYITEFKPKHRLNITQETLTVDSVPSNNILDNIVEYVNFFEGRKIFHTPLNIIVLQKGHKQGEMFLKLSHAKKFLKPSHNVFISESVETIVPFLK